MGEPIFVLRGHNDDILREVRGTSDVSLLVNWVFWNFWTRRAFPYNSIEEGQTLYFVDTKARLISAELRVAAVGRIHYNDAAQPYRVLDRAFGIDGESAESALQAKRLPVPGYLLAVAVDPVAYIGAPVTLDWSKVGGRSGWVAWNTVLHSSHTPEAARELLRALPAEGRPAVVYSHPVDLGTVDTLANLPRASRMPSAASIKFVSDRAAGVCELDGCSERAQHLDHIYPWAHGGNSEAANLQWLCARHNLAKSDRIPDTVRPDQLWLRYLTELDDDTITIGSNLRSHEIRTQNSVYDLVIDDEVFLLWKRGGREIYVETFDGLDRLIVADLGGERIEIPGSPDHDGPLFISSPIKAVTDTDTVETLARIGRRPGDVIPLTRIG